MMCEKCCSLNFCNSRFRLKYHPEEYTKRRDEVKSSVHRRCEVFSKLLELSRLTAVSLDVAQTNDIVIVLDAGTAVIVT